jgi:hypothetical protein
VCGTCFRAGLQVRGRCPGCGYLRILPGRDPSGEAICPDCAGITRDFHCARCRTEGYLWAGRLCTRCVLHDELAGMLDDGTGRTHPELVPLLESLHAMPQPDRGITWLRNNPHLPGYLRGLAQGHILLTHDGLNQLPSWRTAAHLRDLLMACGVLPHIDRQILLFEQWHRRQLAAITNPGHQRLLRQYATWHQLPKLHAAARTTALQASSRNRAAEQFTTAARFLAWLAARDRQLADVTQADLDAWHLSHRAQAAKLRDFLTWAMAGRHAPRRDIPAPPRSTGEPISQDQRIALLRHALTDDAQPLRARVAACLVLLYAQPVSRLTRLTIDDIVHNDNGQVLLRFGDPPSPVPEPFATLLTQLATSRANMNTAANPAARWLFPGGRPGQPLTAGALLPSLRHLAIPVTKARTAALRDLVLKAPAPVIATALGYSHTTTHRHHADAGGTWHHYPSPHPSPTSQPRTAVPAGMTQATHPSTPADHPT